MLLVGKVTLPDGTKVEVVKYGTKSVRGITHAVDVVSDATQDEIVIKNVETGETFDDAQVREVVIDSNEVEVFVHEFITENADWDVVDNYNEDTFE